MARLPQTLDVAAPRGARPSLDAPRPTDFGLGQLAQGMGDLAQAQQKEQALQADIRREADAKTADEVLRPYLAKVEGQFQAAAQTDAADHPNFAQASLAHLDDNLMGVLSSGDPGVREAMGLQAARYRVEVGQRAIEVQSKRQAGVAAAQQRQVDDHAVGGVVTQFETQWGALKTNEANNFDGSTPGHAAALQRDLGEVVKGLRESEAWKAMTPGQQAKADLWLENRQLEETLAANEVERTGAQTFMVRGALKNADALINNIASHPTAYGSFGTALVPILGSLPAQVREKLAPEIEAKAARSYIMGLANNGALDHAAAELDSGRFDTILPPELKLNLQGQIRGEAAQMANSQIEALRYGAEVDPDALRRNAAASGDPGLIAKADWAQAAGGAEGDALAAIGAGGAAARAALGDFASFVIDDLEGGDAYVANDNGKGPTRFGINQAANPDLNVATLTRAQATARVGRYWNAVGGSRLPPALAYVAADAAFNQGPERARQWLAQSDGDPAALIGLRAQAYQELARQPGQEKNLAGWMGRLKKVQDRALQIQAFANVQEGLSSDPIKYALQKNVAQVAPLPTDPAAGDFAAALQARARVGGILNRSYHAPFRMLDNGEAAFWRDRIAQDPTAGLALAERALEAVGPTNARALLGEVGLAGQAGVELHLADLAAAGNSPFARMAVQGLALKAKGQSLDKTLGTEIGDYLDDHKGLFAGQPETLLAVRQAAEAAALAESSTGQPRKAQNYVNEALGASRRQGAVFGGLTPINGGAAIAPMWLRADHFDEVLDHLAEGFAAKGIGPVYADTGKPIPARKISELRPMLMPNGRYRLLDSRGAAVMAPSPRPYDRNRAFAQRRDSYQTALSAPEETAFRAWVASAKVPFNPNQTDADYDMRGYWKDVASKGKSQTVMNGNDHRMHFPDTYKTPFHQSFSAESRYAAPGAPRWANDHQLVDPKTGRIVFDERAPPPRPAPRPFEMDLDAAAPALRARFGTTVVDQR